MGIVIMVKGRDSRLGIMEVGMGVGIMGDRDRRACIKI